MVLNFIKKYTVKLLVLFGLGLTLFSTYNYFFKKRLTIQEVKTTCITSTESKTMTDAYLKGLLERGESYQAEVGYYDCNPVNRDDIVLQKISSAIEPVVRIVRGVPGDSFELKQDEKDKNHWFVKINDKHISDFFNKNYFVKASREPVLKTQELAKNGVLGKDDYIVLSNFPPGMADSGSLGVISKKYLKAKIIK